MNPERIHDAEKQPVSLVEDAVCYGRAGWPVFPLAGKIPYHGTHGHTDATTDETVITAMWEAHPKANIGLATGRRSGILVLDMDVPEGYYGLKALQEQYGQLPETRRSQTLSGGLHYYFLCPDDERTYPNVVGLAGCIGVDFRGEGGYVVLPPSHFYRTKFYRFANSDTPIAGLPDWLHDLLPTKGEHQHYPHGFGFAYPSGEKWLDEAVSRATEGNRNDVGFWLACQLRDDGISQENAQTVMLVYANRVPQEHSPYTSKEALASVRSAYQRPPRERAKSR
jgi:hypothetical protein